MTKYKEGDVICFIDNYYNFFGHGKILKCDRYSNYKVQIDYISKSNFAWMDNAQSSCAGQGPYTNTLCRWISPKEIIGYQYTPKGNKHI